MKPQEIARRLRPIIEKAAVSLEDELALQAVELFPHWDGNQHEYEAQKDRVQDEGLLYRCFQSHKSQSDWPPHLTPNLWERVSDPAEEWPEWIQPIGSTGLYSLGAKVSHNTKHWISDYDNNSWEPGVFGWSETS